MILYYYIAEQQKREALETEYKQLQHTIQSSQ